MRSFVDVVIAKMCPAVTNNAIISAICSDIAKVPKIATYIVNSTEWKMRWAGKKLNAFRANRSIPLRGKLTPLASSNLGKPEKARATCTASLSALLIMIRIAKSAPRYG